MESSPGGGPPESCEPPKPIGFAHRGASAEERQNTIAAFRRALELGAEGLESDAWITADGAVVLDHDGIAGRWPRRRRFSRLKRSELPGLVPTLEELYEACGNSFELSLDLCDPAAVGPLLEVARAEEASGRLWLCHGDLGLLGRIHQQAPEVRLVLSTSLLELPQDLGRAAAEARRAGLDALNLHFRQWTPGRVAAVHEGGLLAFAWDAQGSRELERALEAGVDGVYSDHVGRLVAAVESHRRRRRLAPGQPT